MFWLLQASEGTLCTERVQAQIQTGSSRLEGGVTSTMSFFRGVGLYDVGQIVVTTALFPGSFIFCVWPF